MIKRLETKLASACWEIHGTEIYMHYRKQVSEEETISWIQRYRDTLISRHYVEGNEILCDCFRFFGGISFIKIGCMAFEEDFTQMFRYYADRAVRGWSKSLFSLKAKELGIHIVFQEMLYSEQNPIAYNYRYILDEIPGSHKYQEYMEEIFEAYWKEEIGKTITAGQSLNKTVKKIGILRCADYAAKLEESLAEKYQKDIAALFTRRREMISLCKMVKKVYGLDRPECKLKKNGFDQMLRKTVLREFEVQYGQFPRDNYKEADIKKDVWTFYTQYGPSLRCGRMDFGIIESPSLRLEVKYYCRHRFSGEIQIRDRFITTIAVGVNYMSRHDRRIHFFSDIDLVDAKALHIELENGENTSLHGIITVFGAMKTVTNYLMGKDRDPDMKSPIPANNPFTSFVFHNSRDYVKNAPTIPEYVMQEMDKHIYELSDEYQLFYQLLSQTGMRAKEAVLLEADCLEPSRYHNRQIIKYIPYKVLAARRKSGREDHHRVMITNELAESIQMQIKRTALLRKEYGLPYIFLTKRKNFKAGMINASYFLVKLDQLAERCGLCDEEGKAWHFTARQYRKTVAVELIENGGTMNELSQFLGHMQPTTSAIYYADVRKKKLAEMNTEFFRKKFEVLLTGEQLERFSEEERRALYVDFCLESRRVEFGHCVQKLSDGCCTKRNSLIGCADCRGYSLTSRNRTWGTVSTFLGMMRGFEGISNKNPFHKNPYPSHEKREYKLVPEYVVRQLDTVFMKEDIPLEIRLMYWILRLIPSRINEVLSMRLDCFKAYMGDYVLFIPTWKQNGGHKEPILRSIHIRTEGMGEFLINLLSEQQVNAQHMQEELKDTERGALFTYRRQLSISDGSRVNTGCYGVLQVWAAAYHLKEICKKYEIRDDQGKEYLLTSHQLRHNGITDRLAEGFTIEQVAEMTGHHGEAMIWDSYTHLEQRQEQMLEKQRQVIKEPAAAPYVFGGRIMHIEKELEERLLKNIRAHKVRGGICSDISGCKSDMWNCLECSSFIPDKDQIGYFKEQIKEWEEKGRRFAAFPVMRQNVLRNAGLFQKIINKMESEGIQDER